MINSELAATIGALCYHLAQNDEVERIIVFQHPNGSEIEPEQPEHAIFIGTRRNYINYLVHAPKIRASLDTLRKNHALPPTTVAPSSWVDDPELVTERTSGDLAESLPNQRDVYRSIQQGTIVFDRRELTESSTR